MEKVRDEAQRNGNVNWGEGHVILSNFLRDTLIDSGIFDAAAVEEIRRDIDRILDFEQPKTDGDPYDRLSDRVVEWACAHPDPVPHKPNPLLHL